MEELVKKMLIELGEDPGREGLVKTPERVAASLKELTSGYGQSVDKILKKALFTEDYDEMVIVKDIELFSLCGHHMLPFYGKCHVAYLPNKQIIGISKIPRVVDVFAKRLQVQERLTTQIAKTLDQYLKPKGVAVVIEAKHLCMMMRGVEKQHSVVVTSAMYGAFRKLQSTRVEFLRLIGKSTD